MSLDRSVSSRTSAGVAAAQQATSSAAQRGAVWLLFALWFLWAALLFGGFIFGGDDESRARIPRWARMSSSAVLVLAGWTWIVVAAPTAVRKYAVLIAVGMTLGFIGDLFNAGLLPGVFQDDTIGGIIAFGLGHIAYIAGMLNLEQVIGLKRPGLRWLALAVWLAIGFFGWLYVTTDAPKNAALRWPALPYSLLLAGTAGLASGVALRDRRFLPLAVGGALFLTSDLVLAWELFQGSFRMAGDIVWLTYGPAQMLIVYSIGTAIVAVVARSRDAT
ncbi:MAG: lysoplasmalogenase [Pirellulales bacterium]|nr:lysoplasmalogenase [Pirellulales bacterium]